MIKYVSLFCLSLLLLVLSALPAQAQVPAPIDTSKSLKVRLEGVRYYLHPVKPKQTLYAISVAYGVTIDEITSANPTVDGNLTIGQALRIPVRHDKGDFASEPTPAPTDYFIHRVAQGETLYSLAHQYNVSLAEIERMNPDAADGISIGEILRFPKEGGSNSADEYVPPPIEANYIAHQVKQGETLYSLSKSYDVHIDSIRAANEYTLQYFGGLRTGIAIRIPKKHNALEGVTITESYSSADTVVFMANTKGMDNVFNVAIMLPFFLDINDSLERARKRYEPVKQYPKSSIAVQFYQGALMAVDSLRKKGLSVRLFVYDTENDSTEVRKILARPEMENVQLIIGPLYQQNLEMVTEWTRDRNIQVVCPVRQPNRVLLGNPQLSKVVASPTVQVEALATYIKKKNPTDNVIVLTNRNIQDDFLASAFMNKARVIEDFLGSDGELDTVARHYMAHVSRDSLRKLLSLTRPNVLVVPSNNQAYVTELINNLNHFATYKYEITVYGLDSWRDYSSIDIDYLHNLHLHFPTDWNIDYDSPAFIELARKYREQCHTDPNRWVAAGFDITYYYLDLMRRFGSDFAPKVNDVRWKGVAHSFDFFKTGFESGLENKAVYILTYEDFKLVEVNQSNR